MSSSKQSNPILALFFIPLGGLILLNLAFLLTAVIRFTMVRLININDSNSLSRIPFAMHIGTAVILLAFSYLVLTKVEFNDLYRATFSIVPIAVLLVYTGMFLFEWPIAVYAVSVAIVASILIYLYKTKRPWMYYYALFLISSALLYMQITGIDI